MRVDPEIRKRMRAAYVLLQGKEISISTFEQCRILIKGLDPRVDKKLTICSQALEKLQKIQSGDLITLSVEMLPEESEEQQKRKKIVLTFITTLRDLRSEIKRVEKEFAKADGYETPWQQFIAHLKGPFGIVTILAVIIVGIVLWQNRPIEPSPPDSSTIQVIEFQGKQIPLTQLQVGKGPECDQVSHYHARNEMSVKALDGTVVADPGECGFGKVSEVKVIELK
jgi:hypothetical protein